MVGHLLVRVITRMHERLMTTGMDPVKEMINIGPPNGKRKMRN
jgi:hypothetical protein